MAIPLRQSTASQEVPIGYFLDSTDGNTEETGLTIASTDVKLWKAGATTLANKNSGGATHISNGIYYLVLDATDTNTLGPLVAFVHVSGALPVRLECVVLAANVYDALIAASDALQVDTIQLSGTTQTARDIGASVLLSPGTGTGQISLNSGAVTAGTVSDKTGYSLTATTGLGNQTANITGNLSGSVGSVTGAVGSVTGNVGGNVTGSVGSVLGGINTTGGIITTLDGLDTAQDAQHATTQSNVAAILADTNELQTDDVPGLIAALNNLSSADVNAAVNSALDTAIPGVPTAGSINDVLSDLSGLLPTAGTLLNDTDTFAEPSSIPAATATLPAKIGLITAIARNKLTQTATTQTLRNDADSANIGTAAVSDDGTTFTKGKLA